MLHLPRTRLISIRAGGERPDRANVDAHAALFALQMIFSIGRDDGTHSAVLHAQGPNVHTLATHAHTAVAQNTARTIEEYDGRPLLFILMVLRLHELRFSSAVGESHVLQFALAARIAHRAIQRSISAKQRT